MLYYFAHEVVFRPLIKEMMPHSLPIPDQILIALRQITQAIDLYSRFLMQEHGLTGPQIGVLRHLHRTIDATPGELSDALHITPPTIAGILNRLEQRGLITRVRGSRTDRRSVVVRLTPSGTDAIAKSPPLLRDRFLAQLAGMPAWEQTQMLATLQRVAHLMHADGIDAEPFLHHGPTSPANTGLPASIGLSSDLSAEHSRAIENTSALQTLLQPAFSPGISSQAVSSPNLSLATSSESIASSTAASVAVEQRLTGCDPPSP